MNGLPPAKMVFWVALVVAGGLYGAMLVLTLPALLAGPDQLRPFDARPFGYSVEAAHDYLTALSAEGRAIYLGLQGWLDTFFPAANAVMLIAAVTILFKGRGRAELIALVVIVTFSDYVENRMVAGMLTAPVLPGVGTVKLASAFTIVKSMGTTVVWLVLIWGAVRAWRARI